MPTSPPSLCTKGCGTLVYSGGQCPNCLAETRRQRDRSRPNGYQRGYTRRWSEFSKRYLADHPTCESENCVRLPFFARPASTDVDHIDGTGRGGSNAYDPDNLQALCHSCHSKKTAAENGGFGRKAT